MLSDKQIKKLNGIFTKYNNVIITYLFGSYASNKENRLSDLDLGILLDDDYNKEVKLDILADLAESNFCNVDLVILNEVNLLTQFEIVKHNKVIYKRDDFDSADYFSHVVGKFLDFKPFLEVQRKYLKERLING